MKSKISALVVAPLLYMFILLSVAMLMIAENDKPFVDCSIHEKIFSREIVSAELGTITETFYSICINDGMGIGYTRGDFNYTYYTCMQEGNGWRMVPKKFETYMIFTPLLIVPLAIAPLVGIIAWFMKGTEDNSIEMYNIV